MNKNIDVLERSVLQPGKSFIKEGEDNVRAYVIQNGEVQSFVTKDEKKILVATYGPGTIIGELSLMVNTAPKLSYEATTTTTVITVTRQDFQKRLARSDKTIRTILDHAIKKLEIYEDKETNNAVKKSNIDKKAEKVVEALVQSITEEKQDEFKEDILPHIDGLIKALKKHNTKL